MDKIKCNKCDDSGKLSDGVVDMLTMTPMFKTCDKCNGIKFVEVKQKEFIKIKRKSLNKESKVLKEKSSIYTYINILIMHKFYEDMINIGYDIDDLIADKTFFNSFIREFKTYEELESYLNTSTKYILNGKFTNHSKMIISKFSSKELR